MIGAVSRFLRPSRSPRARGTELVEFLIVLPMILMLFFGLVEGAHLMYRKIQLESATQSAVRVMAQRGGAKLDGNEPQESAVENAAISHGFASDAIKVIKASPRRCTNGATEVVLQTQVVVPPVTPLGAIVTAAELGGKGLVAGNPINITATAVARCEVTWPT